MRSLKASWPGGLKAGLLVTALLTAAPAGAQNRERLAWVAVDAHAATVGLPQAEGWVPVVSADTKLPGRNWGIAGGGTAYPFRLGLVTFGVGASIIRGSGTGESFTITTGTGASATTRVT